MSRSICTFAGTRPRERYSVKWGYTRPGACATYSPSTGAITINPQELSDDFYHTYMHEIVHSAEQTHQMGLCEAEVDIIATHMNNALKKFLKPAPKPPKDML